MAVMTPPGDRDEARSLLSPAPLVVTQRAAWARTTKVALILVAVQASFAGNSVVTRLAVGDHHTDPLTFSLLRDIGGATILLSVARLRGSLVMPRREDVGTFILLGVLGVYIGQMFLTLAFQYVSALNGALLQPSQPVITTGLAALFGMEPLLLGTSHGRLKLVGIVLAAAGAVITVYYDSKGEDAAADGNGTASSAGTEHRSSPSELILGNALLIIQCTCGALYQLVQKHLLSHSDYPPLAVAGLGYAVGAVAIGLVLPVCHVDSSSWEWLWKSPTSCWALAYAIVMTSAFNYSLQAYANKHSSPTLVTAFFPLQIVFTALFSWAANGTKPLWSDYVGAAMIIAGLGGVVAGRVLAARRADKRQAGLDA